LPFSSYFYYLQILALVLLVVYLLYAPSLPAIAPTVTLAFARFCPLLSAFA
jgi:hypothetical protein